MGKRNCLFVATLFIGLFVLGQIQTSAKEIIYVDSQNPYLATSSRYNHIYANPPSQRIEAYGRYLGLSSTVRYVHSPSKLKGAKHAARINAYNYDVMY